MSEITNNDKQDSIELTKNSRGYTWKIKVYYDGDNMSADEAQDRIRRIDTRMKNIYGSDQ